MPNQKPDLLIWSYLYITEHIGVAHEFIT